MNRYSVYFYELTQKWYVWDNQTNCYIGNGFSFKSLAEGEADIYNQREGTRRVNAPTIELCECGEPMIDSGAYVLCPLCDPDPEAQDLEQLTDVYLEKKKGTYYT